MDSLAQKYQEAVPVEMRALVDSQFIGGEVALSETIFGSSVEDGSRGALPPASRFFVL
jgi:hypothetical protein